MRTIHLCLCATFLIIASAASHPSFGAVEHSISNGNSCKAAGDCKGALPTFSKMCSNGIPARAHWACVKAQCVIETCVSESKDE
jgi:hypothetical protein